LLNAARQRRFLIVIRRFLILTSCLCLSVHARDWHVNPQQSASTADGSAEQPFATVQLAVNRALPGDVIHLHPAGAVYRQMITLRNASGFTIEGNGVTLTGADPLSVDDWEQVSPGLYRRQLPEPPMKRHLVIFNGRAQRMNRSPSRDTPFPDPHQMGLGEFAWQAIDGETGWLWVRTDQPLDQLEWSVRTAGVATSGVCRDIAIRHLHTRHALNDGFNIHGDCRSLLCQNVSGYECFDEGFSAHDTCQTTVEDSLFWGNDHAVADVNAAETRYLRCEFRDSVTVEVLLTGRSHHLEDCRIVASAATAFSLRPGMELPQKTVLHSTCLLKNVHLSSRDTPPRKVHSQAGTTLTLDHCTLTEVTLDLQGDHPSSGTTLNGQPWPQK